MSPGEEIAIMNPSQRIAVTTAATDNRSPIPARSGWKLEYFVIYNEISGIFFRTLITVLQNR